MFARNLLSNLLTTVATVVTLASIVSITVGADAATKFGPLAQLVTALDGRA